MKYCEFSYCKMKQPHTHPTGEGEARKVTRMTGGPISEYVRDLETCIKERNARIEQFRAVLKKIRPLLDASDGEPWEDARKLVDEVLK